MFLSKVVGTMPLYISGLVIKGFGRGSKELGIPTANYPLSVVEQLPADFGCGVYYGWAQVDGGPVHKMVMSIGWNPYYQNEKKSMETHILHDFDSDFYGSMLKVCLCGHIRAEKSFDSLAELITEIKNDIAIANGVLDSPKYHAMRDNGFFQTNAKI